MPLVSFLEYGFSSSRWTDEVASYESRKIPHLFIDMGAAAMPKICCVLALRHTAALLQPFAFLDAYSTLRAVPHRPVEDVEDVGDCRRANLFD